MPVHACHVHSRVQQRMSEAYVGAMSSILLRKTLLSSQSSWTVPLVSGKSRAIRCLNPEFSSFKDQTLKLV